MQRRLDELREALDGDVVDKLAARLNQAGSDRVAAMWEVAVFHALALCGTLQTEVPLASGRRPDIALEVGKIRVVADVTAVSDEGLDESNPYSELSALIEETKGKLGLPLGGLHLRVYAKEQRTKRGARTVLRLPPRPRLREFVTDRVAPQLRDQLKAGKMPLHISINDDEVGLDITIDPARSPYSSAAFAAYDVPTIKDRNPLYRALKAKADQLRGARGVTGVIVGDGDCAALTESPVYRNVVPAWAIVEEFFRQHSSIDFVLILTVRKTRRDALPRERPERQIRKMLFMREGLEARDDLEALFERMLTLLPEPVMMPVNGALRARERGYDLGHHGGYSVNGKKVRIGLREMTEVLAGLRRLDDNGAKDVEASRALPSRANHPQLAFRGNLQRGRMPMAVTIIKGGEEEDDDWVEFEFGDPDPAISRLQ